MALKAILDLLPPCRFEPSQRAARSVYQIDGQCIAKGSFKANRGSGT